MMYSLRKWMFKPKKTDTSILAQFFHADEALNQVAAELDSFDGRKDPERCTALVNQLRGCQDKVLVVVEKIIKQVIADEQANRHFRVKFPDDVLQESLAGQLWFGAECLAAGSSIMNREVESASMRPLAKALTKQLDYLRGLLREQCLGGQSEYPIKTKEALIMFDKLFAEFELSYVSAMVPVKSMREFDMLQEVVVLFCETVQRSLKLKLLDQQMIDYYDPALMFTIPRLAIVCGLLVYPEGPINPDKDPMNMSEMFRPFQMLLYKIRELLWTLTQKELWLLEKALSRTDDSMPLTDEAFEEQLNKLNLIEQTRNIHSRLGGYHGNYIYGDVPCDVLEEGIMSHSPSTSTVVAAGTFHADGAVGTIHQKTDLQVQDSCDSDSSSSVRSTEDHNLLPMAESSCKYHELQKSQSWPKAKETRHFSACDMCQQYSDADTSRGFLCSRHLLECYDLEDSEQRVTHTQNLGSSEFSFHLPQDSSARELTGRSEIETARNPHISPDVARAVMYTQNGANPQDDRGIGTAEAVEVAASQIAYVTHALNDHLFIDPNFEAIQAVLVKENTDTSSASGQGRDVPSAKNKSPPSSALINSTVACVTVHCDNTPGDPHPDVRGQLEDPVARTVCDNDNSDCTNKPQTKSHLKKYSDSKTNVCVSENTNNNSDMSTVKTLKYSDVAPDRGGEVDSLEYDWDRESYRSSDTDSHTSETRDEAEISLAIQAAEAAARQEARARFRSNSELIHKLFVCISGVADQLQTNYASDLRLILKEVFECNSSKPEDEREVSGRKERSVSTLPPEWTPDEQAPRCIGCKELFTFVRRRHHCRNCGKVFCGRCSSNNVPLPHFGHSKPVRVCNHCFMFQVTPFTVAE